MMKKLNAKTKILLSEAVSTSGSYDPNESLFYIEERLTIEESIYVESFLSWIHANKLTFGTNNIESHYTEFLKSSQCIEADKALSAWI
jgi:hypothetical protein